MHKVITFIFTFLLVLAAPVYALSNFQYSRLIQTDNSIGYKSIILDQAVFAHSNHLNDLRVINDKDEEIPYYLISISDASTEKESFILTEEAQFTTTQNGTDSIIRLPVNNPNVFYLNIITADRLERTYGLFGITTTSKRYLADGKFSQQEITWTDTNPFDQLELIIHNRDAPPITIKSINVKYQLTKLVFKDLGDSDYRLAYGNNLLRSRYCQESFAKLISAWYESLVVLTLTPKRDLIWGRRMLPLSGDGAYPKGIHHFSLISRPIEASDVGTHVKSTPQQILILMTVSS